MSVCWVHTPILHPIAARIYHPKLPSLLSLLAVLLMWDVAASSPADAMYYNVFITKQTLE